MNITDDTEYLRQLRNGSEAAFTAIYERYNRLLYSLAFRYLKNQDMTEDAVQHVFVKLWEYRREITVSVNLRNYLYTMTKNFILNRIRNDSKAVVHNYRIAQSTETYEDNLFEVIERRELMSAFYQALAHLPPQKREVCLLKMQDKLSNREIAEKMHLSVNTVKTHYAQAIRLLRVYMTRLLALVAVIPGWLECVLCGNIIWKIII